MEQNASNLSLLNAKYLNINAYFITLISKNRYFFTFAGVFKHFCQNAIAFGKTGLFAGILLQKKLNVCVL